MGPDPLSVWACSSLSKWHAYFIGPITTREQQTIVYHAIMVAYHNISVIMEWMDLAT
jgi:hypothetical protein